MSTSVTVETSGAWRFSPALATVDPRITYPCYKSLDDVVDVDRLRSLDEYVTERVERHVLLERDLQFFTGPYRLDQSASDRPGARMIYLAQSKNPDSYFDLNKSELWEPTDAAQEFSRLMEFIGDLPFKATGRILIMYDDVARAGPAHRDHVETDVCHDFIWFRTNLRKPFYMLNPETEAKLYVESYTAWFDTVNQFHGADSCEGLTFSIRVDGVFADAFKERIPVPEVNPASTPALWASLGSDQ